MVHVRYTYLVPNEFQIHIGRYRPSFLHLDLWLRHESAGQKSEQKKGGTLTYCRG